MNYDASLISSEAARYKWVNQFESIAKEVIDSHVVINNGRVFVYINNDNDLRLFQDHVSAKQEGFTKSVTLEKIVALSSSIVPDLNYVDQHRLAKAIHSLAQHHINVKVEEYENSFIKFIPFTSPNINAELEVISVAESLNPTSYGTMEPERMDYLKSFLTQVQYMRRSENGMNGGVIFLERAQHREVFKLMGNRADIICAEQFLAAMGCRTPQAAYICNMHPLGNAILETMRDKLNVIEEEHLEDVQLQLHVQGNDTHNICHMHYASATPFSQVPIVEVESLLQNPQVRKELAKMIFLDAFMGNTDRLSLKVMDGKVVYSATNQGNFMLNIPSNRGDNNYFTLIDNDFSLNEENLEDAKKCMSALLDVNSAFVNPFIVKILDKMVIRRSDDLAFKHRFEFLLAKGMSWEEALNAAIHPLSEEEEDFIEQRVYEEGFTLKELPADWNTMSVEEKQAFKKQSVIEFVEDIKTGMKDAARELVQRLKDPAVVEKILAVPTMKISINQACVLELRDYVNDLIT